MRRSAAEQTASEQHFTQIGAGRMDFANFAYLCIDTN